MTETRVAILRALVERGEQPRRGVMRNEIVEMGWAVKRTVVEKGKRGRPRKRIVLEPTGLGRRFAQVCKNVDERKATNDRPH